MLNIGDPAVNQLKRLLPHVIAISITLLFYAYAQHLESLPSRGGFINLDGIFMVMFWVALGCYVLAFGTTACFIQQKTGTWKFGRSYLIAILISPLFLQPVCYLGDIIEKFFK